MARQQRKQTELGELLGLPQQAVSLRLLGRRSFRAEELAVIAEWLDTPVSELIPVGVTA